MGDYKFYPDREREETYLMVNFRSIITWLDMVIKAAKEIAKE